MVKDDTFIANIARQLWNGYAVVFVGAGFSRNADSTYPMWKGLADRMWEQLHPGKAAKTKAYVDVLGLAEEYQAAFDRPQLDALLLSACHRPNVTNLSLHEDLLSLPWVDVLTTNYDTLLEQATKGVRNIRYSVVLNKNDLSIAQRPRIIKLHGSFPSERPFIITARDYRRYPYDHAAFVNTVRQSILENTLVLIGFSGDDPNFLNWLEWVNIQQGERASRKIYMLDVLPISDSRRKLLSERGIEYHNIVEHYETNGDCVAAFSRFFKDMNDRNNRVDDWPRFEKDDPFHSMQRDGNKEDIEKRCNLLERLKLTYPGWIVPPKDAMENLFFRLSLDNPLLPNETLDIPIETLIRYFYLLTWCYEITLSTWPECLIRVVRGFLSRMDETVTRLDGRFIELEIGLMKARRERGDIDVRADTLRIARDVQSDVSLEQKAKLWYEICLRYITIHDFRRLARYIDVLDLSSLSPIWKVRKAGLYLQVGRIVEAKELLSLTLSFIRDSHISGDGALDCGLLSTESAALTLLYRINDPLRLARRHRENHKLYSEQEEENIESFEDDGNEYLMQLLRPPIARRNNDASQNSEDDALSKERRRYFDRQYELKRYKCDMLEVVGDIASALGSGCPNGYVERAPFDITEIPESSERQWDLFEQWHVTAFMRISSVLGWPLRIEDWVYVKGDYVSYACAKNFGQYGLALSTLVSYGGSREISLVVTRRFLSCLNAVYREMFAGNIVKQVYRDFEESKYDLRPGTWDLLARFIVVPRLSIIRLASQIVKGLYENASALPLAHYDEFILRFAKSIRQSDISAVVPVLSSIRYDRNARSLILGKLPDILSILAGVGFVGKLEGIIKQEDFRYWISSCRDRHRYYHSFCLMNILSAGVLGLLNDEQLKLASRAITEIYPRLRTIADRMPGAIALLYREPWLKLLNPADAAKELLFERNIGVFPANWKAVHPRVISLRRKVDFIYIALAKKYLILDKVETKEALNCWMAVLKNIAPKDDEQDGYRVKWARENLIRIIWLMMSMLIDGCGLTKRDLKGIDLSPLWTKDNACLPIDIALMKRRDIRKCVKLQNMGLELIEDKSPVNVREGLISLLMLVCKSIETREKLIVRIAKNLERELTYEIVHRYIAFIVAVCRLDEFNWEDWCGIINRMVDIASHNLLRQNNSSKEYSKALLIANDLNELCTVLKVSNNAGKLLCEKIETLTKPFAEIFADMRPL